MKLLWDDEDDLLSRMVAISGVGAGVGFGTCGLSALLVQAHAGMFRYVTVAGAVLFFVSVAFLLLSCAVILVRAIVRAFRR